ncbi:hypothetical protein J6590_053978 [Homalodisca vitripennis]|nr:hypothetical protein J6590_053978 [Homalodisca vitripennis]
MLNTDIFQIFRNLTSGSVTVQTSNAASVAARSVAPSTQRSPNTHLKLNKHIDPTRKQWRAPRRAVHDLPNSKRQSITGESLRSLMKRSANRRAGEPRATIYTCYTAAIVAPAAGIRLVAECKSSSALLRDISDRCGLRACHRHSRRPLEIYVVDGHPHRLGSEQR